MIDDALFMVRGEYATLEREVEGLRADFRHEVKGLECFAMSLSRNGVMKGLCNKISGERRRMERIEELCRSILRIEERMDELRPLTGWFDSEKEPRH